MYQPTIRGWLTPAGFAAAVPQLANYPLPAIAHALARLRTTAIPALAAPDTAGPAAVYLVAPAYVLLVDATGEASDDNGRQVHLPPPLSGSAAASMPVPVIDVDTLGTTLRDDPNCALRWPTGDAPYPDGFAHRAVAALTEAAGATAHALSVDSEQDLTLILPALAAVLDHLAATADGLTPYCGDFSDHAETRLATITALLTDSAEMARRAHTDVAARLDTDHTLTDLRLTEVVLRPHWHRDARWMWNATGHLRDTRTSPGGYHATITTEAPHPDMGPAIDAIRTAARRFDAARPDHPARQPLLRLAAPTGAPAAGWQAELAGHAARLRMRLPATP